MSIPAESDRREVAAAITRAREARRWTKTKLALLLRVSPPMVTKWESGDVGIRPPTLMRIAEAFGCSAEQLLAEEPPHLVVVPEEPEGEEQSREIRHEQLVALEDALQASWRRFRGAVVESGDRELLYTLQEFALAFTERIQTGAR